MKLNIPKFLNHNGERFFLQSIENQKIGAIRISRELAKVNIRSRIKFIDNKFAIYGDRYEEKK